MTTPSYASSINANFDLTAIQKDDTDDQNNVDNHHTSDQTVKVTTEGTAPATTGKYFVSPTNANNEVDLNTYQYNARHHIDEDLGDKEIDSISSAINDESSDGGNDDSINKNTATQDYIVNARQGATINSQSKVNSDQALTIAQFNAGCDDDDDDNYGLTNDPDVTCQNTATNRINLDAQATGPLATSSSSNILNFDTYGPIEVQEVNECGSGDPSTDLECTNEGKVDVNAVTRGVGVANIQLGNLNGQPVSGTGAPVLFEANDCSQISDGGKCLNIAKNYFDIQKSGANSKITETKFGLNVAEVNKCDSARSSIDCVNSGLQSIIHGFGPDPDDTGPLLPRNIFDEFSAAIGGKAPLSTGGATSIVTVNAIGAGSVIEKANPTSIITMDSYCDGYSSTSLCGNAALNEAHFVANTGDGGAFNPGIINVAKGVQKSDLENDCFDLDAGTCTNTFWNTFTADSSGGSTINLGTAGFTQTHDYDNACYDEAQCSSTGKNIIDLVAAGGSTIKTTSDSTGINQLTNGDNKYTYDATCEISAHNTATLFADLNSIIDIKKLDQTIDYTNDCGSGETCKITGQNTYIISNTSGKTLTVDSDQSLSYYNTGNTNAQQTNYVSIAKSSTGGNLYVDTSQSASGANVFNQILTASGGGGIGGSANPCVVNQPPQPMTGPTC